MKYEQLYQALRQDYTDEEIAESMMIPADLTETEQAKAHQEMSAYRMERLRSMSDEDRILSDVMRLRFQIEHYLKQEAFSFEHTFGKYLTEYIRLTKKTRREISEDLAIHYTKLSRIVNDKEEPNIELSYRLEKHSENLISALLWWKLMIKKQEYLLSQDEQTRQAEHGKVKNFLRAG